MSAENLIAFQHRVATDAALQQKVAALHQEGVQELAEKMAALSIELGTPFTAEEFLAPADLSDAQLDGVAGGASPTSSGGFLGHMTEIPPALKWANEVAYAQLRNSNVFGNNPPKEAY